MEPHHAESIRQVTAFFQADPAVRALLLGGSLAHGCARPDSDVDVAIIVTPEEYARRRAENKLTISRADLCTYPQGYLDGKYLDESFLRQVAERGSEPARYAFDGVRVLFSRLEGLEPLLAAIVRYPAAGKAGRIARFAAQLVGWRWFYSEGARHDNAYLRQLAVTKVVLFSCRLVLAENERLFPFHKWMLRATLSAPRLPPGFGASLDRLLSAPTFGLVDAHCRATLAFAGLDHDAVNATWGGNFLRDVELRWLADAAAIDDC